MCLSNLCRVYFFRFFSYTLLSILSILLYFFPGRTCRCATSFEFFVMMYVYIIRKIIIVTIVEFNLILIQTINLISVKFFFISF